MASKRGSPISAVMALGDRDDVGVDDWEADLIQEAGSVLPEGLRFAVAGDGQSWTTDIVRADGTVVWRAFSHGIDPLRATLAAEQRYLAEEVGSGTVLGATYADKAEERVRRSHP
jgi:hypothetical protein